MQMGAADRLPVQIPIGAAAFSTSLPSLKVVGSASSPSDEMRN